MSKLNLGIWDSYGSKKLIRYTYKFSNFRLVYDQNVAYAAKTEPFTAPASQVTSTVQPAKFTLWYWKLNSGVNVSGIPTLSDEAMMKKVTITHPNKGHIWGKVPINTAKMNSVHDTYDHFVTDSSGAMANMDNFLLRYDNTYQIGPTGNPSNANQYTGDVYIMPEDPYPSTWYVESATLSRNCTVSLVADCTCYSTWSLRHAQPN